MAEEPNTKGRGDFKLRPLKLLWILVAVYVFVLAVCLGVWIAAIGWQKFAQVRDADLWTALFAMSVPLLSGFAAVVFQLWRGKLIDFGDKGRR